MMTDLQPQVAYTAKKFIDKIAKGKAKFCRHRIADALPSRRIFVKVPRETV